MAYGEIRTVYAVLPDGSQIVRYDRSKRWFHEDVFGRRIKRFRRVSDAAALVTSQDATVFLSRPQGTYFDKYVEGFWSGTPVPPIERYTRAGLEQAIKRAQAKYDYELRKWDQANPYWKGRRGEWFERYYGLPPKPKVLQRRRAA